MANSALSLADGFKEICQQIDESLDYPNPDEIDGGWQKFSVLPLLDFSVAGLDHIQVGTRSVSVLRLVHSLMSYSYNKTWVALDLWQNLVFDADIKSEIDLLVQLKESDLHAAEAAEIVPKAGHSWKTIAQAVSESECIKECLKNFAHHWFETLLLPYIAAGNAPTPSSAKTANRNQKRLREQLFLRDGYMSAIDHVLELETPAEKVPPESEYTSSASLQTAHIVPFCASAREGMREMLQIFSGGEILADQFVGQNINDPSNAFLLTSDHHSAFGKFSFSIDATPPGMPTKYSIKLFKPAKKLPRGLQDYQDNDEIFFGGGSDGGGIPKPSPMLLRIHSALARVLHASRAAEAIMAMLREEEDLKALGATGEEWGSVGAAYINRRLSNLGVA